MLGALELKPWDTAAENTKALAKGLELAISDAAGTGKSEHDAE